MQRTLAHSILFLLALGGCDPDGARAQSGTQAAPPVPDAMAEAIFAGGCFWCMEGPFEALDGVRSVLSGYTGGHAQRPSYEDVGRGRTGHLEAVRVVYDPSRISYERLLEVFWHNVDPTDDGGQFCDRGATYRTAIFVLDAEQRRLAEASLARVRAELRQRVVTRVLNASTFWVAEAYHQDFHRTNPARYQSYRLSCGRDRRLRELWGAAAAH
ncbi:MAG: peptide-methionine (S)-S-oxide reductase MsrA [Sandaracinaceae bacterium]|nr:peptide-methionine (S)-S-oxide reductase MsrA [Sandaracinaceae bacterium]